MNKKLIYLLVCVVTVLGVVFAGCVWYFMYYTKTPSYSLNLIRESFQTHDSYTFKKHVDLERVLSHVIDDYFGASFPDDKKSENTFVKGLAEGFVNIAKPIVVPALKDAIIQKVEGGNPKNATPSAKNEIGTDANLTIDQLNVTSMKFKKIAYEKKEGKTAVVGITIFDEKINSNFTFELKMSELSDGTWQVTEILNAKDYFIKQDRIEKRIVKKYLNEITPIRELAHKKNEEIFKKYGPVDILRITSQQIDEHLAIERKCLADIKKITVPPAAKNLADLIISRYELKEEIFDLYRKLGAGDHSVQILTAIETCRDNLQKNRDQIEKIEDSVKNIKLDS